MLSNLSTSFETAFINCVNVINSTEIVNKPYIRYIIRDVYI